MLHGVLSKLLNPFKIFSGAKTPISGVFDCWISGSRTSFSARMPTSTEIFSGARTPISGVFDCWISGANCKIVLMFWILKYSDKILIFHGQWGISSKKTDPYWPEELPMTKSWPDPKVEKSPWLWPDPTRNLKDLQGFDPKWPEINQKTPSWPVFRFKSPQPIHECPQSGKKMSIFYLFGDTWEPENQSILDYSKLVWDITTKISPFLDLMRTQLFAKFGDPCCTQNGFPAKTILNFSRARQAYFLSYYLQIWKKCISLEYVQMVK